MSRYYYIVILLALSLFLGCSRYEYIEANSIKILDSNLTSKFSKEDELVLFALDASSRGDFKSSATYYKQLYNQTGKTIYAKEGIKNSVIIKDYDSVKNILEKVSLKDHNDSTLDSYLVAYYIDKNMLNQAKELADSLLKKNRNAKNLELSGLVYEGLGEYKRALNLYEESYLKDRNDYSILKISNLLFEKMDQKTEAKRVLETHSALNGCTKAVCGTLIKFYSKTDDIRGIAQTLKKLYYKTKNREFALELVQLYAREKNYNDAIEFLKESRVDDSILLDIYTVKEDYKNALKLSKKLYKERGEPIYLARVAVLEFETSEDQNSKKMLKSVTEKFEQIVDILDDPLYYNYYGYLLIDKDLDIDKGIELVKKALKVEPNSHYYIDSLAWGLYKKGRCQEALDLLEPISKNSDEEEIHQHIQSIKKCIKEGSR